MEKEKLLHARYLDILFDKRNKSYGGYELRNRYPARVRKALTAVMVVVGIATAIPVIAGIMGNDVRPPVITRDLPTNLTPLEIDRTPEPPKIAPPPSPSKVAMKDFSPPVITPDEKVTPDDLIAENKDLDKAQIGNQNIDGDATDTDISVPSDLNGTGTGGPAVVDAPAPSDKPHVFVEQMPEFNGDLRAFLGSKLRYPDQAREAGIEGKVFVRFVVNEDGDITGTEVMRGIGGGCDEEAMRVVNAMPKWRPGKQNGHPVKVYFTLPIVFELD